MKRNDAESCRERRRQQVWEQTWQRARRALTDRGLHIFIKKIFFLNVGLDEEKGKFRGAERRGDYRSPSVNGPGGEKAGYPRASGERLRRPAGALAPRGAAAPHAAGWPSKPPLAAARASLVSLSSPSLWRGLLTRPASGPRTSISALTLSQAAAGAGTGEALINWFLWTVKYGSVYTEPISNIPAGCECIVFQRILSISMCQVVSDF